MKLAIFSPKCLVWRIQRPPTQGAAVLGGPETPGVLHQDTYPHGDKGKWHFYSYYEYSFIFTFIFTWSTIMKQFWTCRPERTLGLPRAPRTTLWEPVAWTITFYSFSHSQRPPQPDPSHYYLIIPFLTTPSKKSLCQSDLYYNTSSVISCVTWWKLAKLYQLRFFSSVKQGSKYLPIRQPWKLKEWI